MEQAAAETAATASGNRMHAGELQPPLYLELRRLAAAQMAHEAAGQTIQATELVHEAWLRLSGAGFWQNPGHFFAAAAGTMRRILIDRARRKLRVKRGGDLVRVGMTCADAATAAVPKNQVLLINEALERLEKIDPTRARVVVLKFFGDLSNQEVAAELGVTERSVERYWAFAKAWLYREIRHQD